MACSAALEAGGWSVMTPPREQRQMEIGQPLQVVKQASELGVRDCDQN